jgi:hypothetical protein
MFGRTFYEDFKLMIYLLRVPPLMVLLTRSLFNKILYYPLNYILGSLMRCVFN